MDTHREYIMAKKLPDRFLPIDYYLVKSELRNRFNRYMIENNVPLGGIWSQKYHEYVLYEEDFDWMVENIIKELLFEGYPKSFDRQYIKYSNRYNMTQNQMKQVIGDIKRDLLPSFINKVKMDFKTDYISNGKIKFISKQNEYKQKIIEDKNYNKKPVIEKILISHLDGRTAPTLKIGWIILFFLLFFEAFFFGRIIAWILTIIMFIIWRKKEIDNYN